MNETCIIQNNKCDNNCFCNKDFVRETPNGPCIPILKCPPNNCKINEIFECRNPTCDDEGCCIEKGRSCKDVLCENKCYCANGFVRIDGACVSRDNCFKYECPANEYMGWVTDSCGQIDYTCKHPGPDPNDEEINCLEIEDGYFQCYCKKGFVRENKVCIPIENCPNSKLHQ